LVAVVSPSPFYAMMLSWTLLLPSYYGLSCLLMHTWSSGFLILRSPFLSRTSV